MLTLLPPDLDESAKSTGALERKRSVRSGAELLRLAMAYGVCGLTLRGTSAWASVSGVAKMSDVAILKRLRKCGDWLNLLSYAEACGTHVFSGALLQRAAIAHCGRQLREPSWQEGNRLAAAP